MERDRKRKRKRKRDGDRERGQRHRDAQADSTHLCNDGQLQSHAVLVCLHQPQNIDAALVQSQWHLARHVPRLLHHEKGRTESEKQK
jgi:hypothetical protein